MLIPVSMNSIVRASGEDAFLLSEIARRTFIESHGHSASPEDINAYVGEKYNPDILLRELSDPGNIYHIIYTNDRATGDNFRTKLAVIWR